MTDIADMMDEMDNFASEDWKQTPFFEKVLISLLYIIATPFFLLFLFGWILADFLERKVALLTRKSGASLSVSVEQQDEYVRHIERGEEVHFVKWDSNGVAVWEWRKEK